MLIKASRCDNINIGVKVQNISREETDYVVKYNTLRIPNNQNLFACIQGRAI